MKITNRGLIAFAILEHDGQPYAIWGFETGITGDVIYSLTNISDALKSELLGNLAIWHFDPSQSVHDSCLISLVDGMYYLLSSDLQFECISSLDAQLIKQNNRMIRCTDIKDIFYSDTIYKDLCASAICDRINAELQGLGGTPAYTFNSGYTHTISCDVVLKNCLSTLIVPFGAMSVSIGTYDSYSIDSLILPETVKSVSGLSFCKHARIASKYFKAPCVRLLKISSKYSVSTTLDLSDCITAVLDNSSQDKVVIEKLPIKHFYTLRENSFVINDAIPITSLYHKSSNLAYTC